MQWKLGLTVNDGMDFFYVINAAEESAKCVDEVNPNCRGQKCGDQGALRWDKRICSWPKVCRVVM